jgi:hypothetical protein
VEKGFEEDQNGNIPIVVGNLIPIAIVPPHETIVHVNESFISL